MLIYWISYEIGIWYINKMGKSGSKLQEEVIINNNAGASSSSNNITNNFQKRVLSDFELVLLVLGILLLGLFALKKLKEYLNKVVHKQVVAQNI